MLLRSASDIWLGAGLGLEPLRQNHFQIAITDNRGRSMPDLGQYTVKTIPAISNAVQVGQYAMVNSYFPMPSVKDHAGSVPFTFRATTDTAALRYFQEWRNSVYSPVGDIVGLYREVIGSGEIRPYMPGDGKCPDAPAPANVAIRMEGIWPTEVLFNDWNMDAEGDHATFQVTFAITDAYIVGA